MLKPIRTTKIQYALILLLVAAILPSCDQTRQQAQPNKGLTVVDDFGRKVSLHKPAQRIVALSPHIVENLFSAGLGQRIVATVDYANFPAEANAIPRVGGFANFSLESIIAFQPDLVVGWGSGYAGFEQLVERLETLDIAVYVDEPKTLVDISHSVRNLALLGATTDKAEKALQYFESQLQHLQISYASKGSVKVFYPIWPKPLQTLNREHIVNSVIELCGGENIFADAPVLAPIINRESVLALKPEVIIASASENTRPQWLDDWRTWNTLPAVINQQLYFVPGDLLSRHTLRMLEGAKKMCRYIDKARAQLKNSGDIHAK
jgi:iron complex transport system substrate-binding protein